MITIDKDLCTRCQLCVKTCPVDALSMEDNDVLVSKEKCTLCGICISACPTDAISMERKKQTADVSKYSDVWVFAEQKQGKMRPVALELLGIGKTLAAELGQRLCAVLLGNDVKDMVKELASHGAELVYVMEDPLLDSYATDVFRPAISSLITKHKPSIFLFGATHVGRDLAPSIAANLGLGLTADCTGLSIDDEGLLLQTRPAFGGNLMADIICPDTRPQMATVRPNVMKRPEPEGPGDCEIIKEDFEIDSGTIRTEILEFISGTVEGETGVEEADIVVSGGRGVKTEEGFAIIKELASALGGTFGCSRPLVEMGWLPKARQVGQSGKTVSPKLYVACGISGAVQHEVGIKSSDTIIAINKDPEAPIFNIADVGVVGDLFEVIPELIQILQEKKEKSS